MSLAPLPRENVKILAAHNFFLPTFQIIHLLDLMRKSNSSGFWLMAIAKDLQYKVFLLSTIKVA